MWTMKRFLALLAVISVAAGGDGDDSSSCPDSSSCLDAHAFQDRVASFYQDESVLSLLRGTVNNVISSEDAKELVDLLPLSDFVEAVGYETDYKDRRAYTAPVAYAGLGLKELSKSNEKRYAKVLQIREKIRLATETSLNLCPGSLKIDYTTISHKTTHGAHRPHADNCVHFFDENTKTAICDPSREHPYPKRVAASILYLNNPTDGHFKGGEFYFANRTNFGEVEDDGKVEVEAGKMIYFTSGVENLHGALRVERESSDGKVDDVTPRRLAVAMWYVFDETLEEFVPSFQEQVVKSSSSLESNLKPRKVYDANDPTSPKELFTLPIPDRVDMNSLFDPIGSYLVSQQNTPSAGSWSIGQYEESTLHALFKDHSAMFSIDFGVALDDEATAVHNAKGGVVVERHTDGSKPASLQYMLQESVLLHGLLDHFYNVVIAKGLNGDEKDVFDHGLRKARGSLPARKA
jgi:hypothetical protein